MLSRVRRCASCVVALGLFTALRAVHADAIAISVSAIATGSLAGQHFTDSQVTWTAQTTTQEIAACAAGAAHDGCSYFENATQRQYLIPFSTGTVSVAGVGTYALTGPETIDFFAGIYDPEQIRLLNGTGKLSLGLDMPNIPYGYNFDSSLAWQSSPEGSFRDNGCNQGPPEQCSVFATTRGGELRLTGALRPVSGRIDVNGAGSLLTPEPGTWLTAGTGLMAALGAVRRRRGIAARD